MAAQDAPRLRHAARIGHFAALESDGYFPGERADVQQRADADRSRRAAVAAPRRATEGCVCTTQKDGRLFELHGPCCHCLAAGLAATATAGVITNQCSTCGSTCCVRDAWTRDAAPAVQLNYKQLGLRQIVATTGRHYWGRVRAAILPARAARADVAARMEGTGSGTGERQNALTWQRAWRARGAPRCSRATTGVRRAARCAARRARRAAAHNNRCASFPRRAAARGAVGHGLII